MSRLFVCGDTHGSIDIQKLSTTNFVVQKELTKADVVFILGDFGLLWKAQLSKDEKYWIDWLNNKNFTTYFLDGNHENFDRLVKLPRVSPNSIDFGVVADSVFHVRRGSVIDIGGRIIFVMGGGESIDKLRRTMGVSWWPEEIPSYQEMDEAIGNLDSNGYAVDYVFTHVAPAYIKDKIIGMHQDKVLMTDPLEKFLDYVDDSIVFKKWYFGHYHVDTVIDDRYYCLYDKIREVEL